MRPARTASKMASWVRSRASTVSTIPSVRFKFCVAQHGFHMATFMGFVAFWAIRVGAVGSVQKSARAPCFASQRIPGTRPNAVVFSSAGNA